MYGFYGIDMYFLVLVVPALLFSFYAQFKIKHAFGKYSKYTNTRGLTGADISRDMLKRNGINDVIVEEVAGKLTDHYDPRTKVVRLSETVYSSTSIAALGVAAHETGHALQHKYGYAPLVLRSSLVPVAGVGSAAGPWMAILGIMFNWSFLIQAGIVLFAVAVLFYLVTLPVEFNASSRAIDMLEQNAILTGDEIDPAKKVLRAAAMTYVASAAVAMANLIRLIMLANSNRDE